MGIGRAIVPMLDLSGCKKLLDLAGGPGTYAVLMAQANPGLSCVVLDLPPVARVANELIAQAGMAERVRTLPGDYHTTAFPGGMDVVTIFGALHQESPKSIRDILRRAHAALVPGGRIFILDLMTDATHTQPVFSALFAVNMALTTENGWVFSDAEISGWLREAGFENCSVAPVPPPMPHWLATARK
jgi:cyclopropane fatty-acyl-phospholipid synthase-like methyltransferase